MITFIFLVVSIILQISTRLVIGNEMADDSIADNHYVQLNKRYLGSLAKNRQLPPVQQRSVNPPMISTYPNRQRVISFYDDLNGKEKRSLASLARNGDLNKQQQKRASLDSMVNDELLGDIRFSSKDDLPNPMILKQDMINNLRPVILGYLNDFAKKYDPRKIDLFLENLANAVYDQNEEVSMESIKTLVQSDYFQPEEGSDLKKNNFYKRNIQSVARDSNMSSGSFFPDLSSKQPRRSQFYTQHPYDFVERNLESIIKNQFIKRYLGAMAKNNALPPRVAGGKRSADDSFELISDDDGDDDDGDGVYFKSVGKRHTMYDINEPDITFEYPSQTGEQVDYNDYAEQDAAISIGKRYLGALARSGWLPREFAHRSTPVTNSAYESKRHVTDFLRRGRELGFRPPLGPRAMLLKSEPEVGRCRCKRSADQSWTPSSRGTNLRGSPSGPSATSRPSMLARQASSLLDKRFLLTPAVDHFLLL